MAADCASTTQDYHVRVPIDQTRSGRCVIFHCPPLKHRAEFWSTAAEFMNRCSAVFVDDVELKLPGQSFALLVVFDTSPPGSPLPPDPRQ